MFTAHRIDEARGHLAHAIERMNAAMSARDSDAREYEVDHVLTDLGQAQIATQRMVSGIRQHYPRESAELDKVTAIATPSKRAASLSGAHKAATFAHLTATILYNQAHALRHAQSMQGECGDGDGALWNFDASHCASHLAEAMHHVGKLTGHIRDNYPQEAKWMQDLQDTEKDPARVAASANGHISLNGHGGR
jgi:hypothetical protein